MKRKVSIEVKICDIINKRLNKKEKSLHRNGDIFLDLDGKIIEWVGIAIF